MDETAVRGQISALEIELHHLRHVLLENRGLKLPATTLHLVVLWLNQQQYALLLSAVVEVVRMVEIAPLPGAPPSIAGLINVRGTVVPVIDLRRAFHMPPRPYGPNTPIIIMSHDGKKRALVADAMQDVVVASASDMENPDRTMPLSHVVLCVLRRAEGLLAILDHNSLLTIEEEEFLEAEIPRVSP